MTYLDSTLKSRDDILLTKVLSLKAMIFPVIMYRCESWIIKEATHWIINGFELWCWGKLLRIHWAAIKPNQLILKEINSEYSLEGLMLKLKIQNIGHLICRVDSLGKTLMLCREQELRPWQRSWGRRLGIRKGRIEPQKSPWKFSSIYPQNQSLPTFCFGRSSTTLTTGGCPPLPLSEKRVNL